MSIEENNSAITPNDELTATDLSEISGGTGHYGGGGKGGGKGSLTGDVSVIRTRDITVRGDSNEIFDEIVDDNDVLSENDPDTDIFSNNTTA